MGGEVRVAITSSWEGRVPTGKVTKEYSGALRNALYPNLDGGHIGGYICEVTGLYSLRFWHVTVCKSYINILKGKICTSNYQWRKPETADIARLSFWVKDATYTLCWRAQRNTLHLCSLTALKYRSQEKHVSNQVTLALQMLCWNRGARIAQMR